MKFSTLANLMFQEVFEPGSVSGEPVLEVEGRRLGRSQEEV